MRGHCDTDEREAALLAVGGTRCGQNQIAKVREGYKFLSAEQPTTCMQARSTVSVSLLWLA